MFKKIRQWLCKHEYRYLISAYFNPINTFYFDKEKALPMSGNYMKCTKCSRFIHREQFYRDVIDKKWYTL